MLTHIIHPTRANLAETKTPPEKIDGVGFDFRLKIFVNYLLSRAMSVGIVGREALLDLNYAEDSRTDVDFNVVMNSNGDFVEVQGTGEGATFSRAQMDELLRLAKKGIEELLELQEITLSDALR